MSATCESLFGCNKNNVSKCKNKAAYIACLTETNSLELHTLAAIQAIFALGQKGFPINFTNIKNCAQLLCPTLIVDSTTLTKALAKGVKQGLFRTINCDSGTLYEICPGAPNLNPALTKYSDYIRMFNSSRAVYPDFEV
jgi:hypothetical protein